MKYLSKISLVVTVALTVMLPILAAVNLAGAAGNGSANMYLAPAGNSYAQGASFDLDIHEDSGSDTVNAAQAFLSYPSNLAFVSITPNSTDWPVQAQSTGGNGSVSIIRAAFTPVTGDKVIATVRFTATGSGSAAVTFGSNSKVVRSGDNGYETMTYQNGSYSVTNNASMSLSPASKSVTQGSSLDVQVYGDSGSAAINAVQANFSYPADKLAFVSITPNTTDWPVQAVNSGGNGLVQIGRGICGGCTALTGSHLLATVRFTASNTGTAAMSFTTGTGMISSSTNTPIASANSPASYTITAASGGTGGGAGGGTGGSTGGSGGTTTKGSTSKASTSTSPAPQKTYTSATGPQSSPATSSTDTAGPVISDIKVTNLTTKSATINWTTSEPANSEVDFGLDKKYILTTSDSAYATTHSLALDSKELAGHKKYHFIVKSTDKAGNLSTSQDMTFSTGGLQITTTEIIAAASAAVLAGGAWLAAAGGLHLGGGMLAASGGGIYVEPKPIIVGGGAPPPPPTPVVHPQAAAPASPQTTAKTPAKAPAPGQEPQTPGKVIGPKSPPAASAENQTLPKWVKK
jgi:hypothetical protein